MPRRAAQDPEEVTFLNPFTCGICKDGGTRYKIDPETGRRTDEVDNELGDNVGQLLAGHEAPGAIRVPLDRVISKRVLVPRYYDMRWLDDFHALLAREGLESISLGELKDRGIITVRGGHGSPSNDRRSGTIPYIKVSDIRGLRININPTNLVTRAVAESFWRGAESGLRAWDLITPNRASSNIGEFAVMLPGEEDVVMTKEIFAIRVVGGTRDGWDSFYLLWALCLKSVRKQWQRVSLMQTNREDVAGRHREILVPEPRDAEWASSVAAPFRDYFTALAAARTSFLTGLSSSGYGYIASAHSVGSVVVEEDGQVDDGGETSVDGDDDGDG